MSQRNLDQLFAPRAVALIGASRRPGSLGALHARNLFNADFQGAVMPVHPEHYAVEGVLAYPSVADLPTNPDLAVIATPPEEAVAGLVRELGARGTKAAVVITAGFGEGGDAEGAARRQAVLEAARPHLLRVVGPNCLGVMVPERGLNASFSHLAPRSGDIAFVTQSGAMETAILDWAAPRGIGFSKVVSMGAMADVDFGDMLDYLAMDRSTRAILLYIEAVTGARKFVSAARAAARTKPVIVIKGGRFAAGMRAASSHTGALAGADDVYDAVFARAGLLRVRSLDELFDAAAVLARARPGRGDRVAILTNGGGLGVLAADAVVEEGGRLAELGTETLEALDRVLPATWSRGNPVDIIGDAPGERYREALEVLLQDPGSDAVLVLNVPTGVAPSKDAAAAVAATVGKARRPVFAAWVGAKTAQEGRDLLNASGIPTFATPEQAARAFMYLERYRRNQEQLMETPPSVPQQAPPNRAAAAAIVAAALAEGRAWLDEAEAKAVLAAYGIPTVETRVVRNPDAAVEAAAEIGFPVALKVLSPEVIHKSEVGGVCLNLESAQEVRAAAEAMRARLALIKPEARLAGFTVQAMYRRPGAQELILGMVEDEQFGPVILFGHGGTAVEVLRDRAIGLPPLNMALARALMARTRIHRLLEGYRTQPPAALDEVARALVNLAQLVIDLPQVTAVDINPLLADERGVIALDARMQVADKGPVPADRLAIRPYPRELEETFTLQDGRKTLLRPVRPEDEPAIRAAFKKLTPEDVRMRFFAPLRELGHPLAARLTQIDYEREMAIIAVDPDDESDAWGVVRIAADPDKARAEFAVTVRSDMKGRGLGYGLMQRILRYAAAAGIGEVWGDVLAENRDMLQLARELGFTSSQLPEDRSIVRVAKRLDAPAANSER